jgi:hypothetical protein
MATTTNYSWSTPDDTALVKDGAAAIRSLGSSVDTTTKALNPSTTLGDIEYRSSTANTNTRLGIGTDGQVLTVASGVPSWATPGGASTNFTLLNAGGTATTSGSTVTVSGISGQDKLFIRLSSISATSTFRQFWITFNSDTSTNYFLAGGELTTDTPTVAFSAQASGNDFSVARMGDNATNVVSGFLTVLGCNSSGIKSIISNCGSTGTTGIMRLFQGYYAGTSTISSVSITCNGTFDAGSIFVYGSSN